MHIQIVNFELRGVSFDQYQRLCEDFVPAFTGLPGLRSKTWLANQATGTFGGVYVWETREAMDAYLASPLFAAVVAHPNFAGVRSTDFEVLEAPTRATHGLMEVAA